MLLRITTRSGDLFDCPLVADECGLPLAEEFLKDGFGVKYTRADLSRRMPGDIDLYPNTEILKIRLLPGKRKAEDIDYPYKVIRMADVSYCMTGENSDEDMSYADYWRSRGDTNTFNIALYGSVDAEEIVALWCKQLSPGVKIRRIVNRSDGIERQHVEVECSKDVDDTFDFLRKCAAVKHIWRVEKAGGGRG